MLQTRTRVRSGPGSAATAGDHQRHPRCHLIASAALSNGNSGSNRNAGTTGDGLAEPALGNGCGAVDACADGTGVGAGLLGSVSQSCVQHATCPVLVFRGPHT